MTPFSHSSCTITSSIVSSDPPEVLTSHLQQILEWFVPALYRGLSITNLVSVQIETFQFSGSTYL